MNKKVSPQCSVKLTVTGRVQGVGYRAWCKASARQLGLKGWVRNLENGAVEVVLTGGSEQVEMMARRCYEGPMAAAVLLVKKQVIKAAPPKPLKDFIIRKTQKSDPLHRETAIERYRAAL